MMKFLIAGCFSLSLAFLWSRLLRGLVWSEQLRLGIAIPIGEEIIKLSIAKWFGIPPIYLYLVFGFGEGLLESFSLKKRLDYQTITAGLVTHFVFGLFYLFPVTQFWSLLMAIITHILWNNTVIYQK